ncbi:hypothetical protein C2E23DRAFT_862427 [Lenzites betulinus]|nr:hypothetical protein C2E23DRAFT_862427 [Lenzites betulinus]
MLSLWSSVCRLVQAGSRATTLQLEPPLVQLAVGHATRTLRCAAAATRTPSSVAATTRTATPRQTAPQPPDTDNYHKPLHTQINAIARTMPSAPPPWPTNQANRQHNVDLRRAWVPSPVVPAADVDGPGEPHASESGQSSGSGSSGSTHRSRKDRTRRGAGDDGATAAPGALGALQASERRERPQSWISYLHPKRLFAHRRSRAETEDGAVEEHVEGRSETKRREVAPAEWRAYGYWARPYINLPWGFRVNNATPPDSPRELSPAEVDAMLAGLREPGGQTFPENWVPRVTHFSLPPRPDLWPTPPQTFDPLPGTLQLNPWLTHRATGPSPLHFDLRLRAEDAQLNTREDRYGARRAEFRAFGPNGAQPATYPGVPRLRICALAGDAQPVFWWPFTVLAHHEALPVQVRDVLDALVANFEERMTLEEFNLLSDERAGMLHRAYGRRTALVVGGRPCPKDDGLRRVDYLGDNICFRGLEPMPDGEGFMMFVGPPP